MLEIEPAWHFLAVGTVSNGSISTVSSRFRLFWALEAARAKTKETIEGIKVAYDLWEQSALSFRLLGSKL